MLQYFAEEQVEAAVAELRLIQDIMAGDAEVTISWLSDFVDGILLGYVRALPSQAVEEKSYKVLISVFSALSPGLPNEYLPQTKQALLKFAFLAKAVMQRAAAEAVSPAAVRAAVNELKGLRADKQPDPHKQRPHVLVQSLEHVPGGKVIQAQIDQILQASAKDSVGDEKLRTSMGLVMDKTLLGRDTWCGDFVDSMKSLVVACGCWSASRLEEQLPNLKDFHAAAGLLAQLEFSTCSSCE